MATQTEQETFGKSLEKLDKVVAGFGKHQDVSRTKEVAAEVKRLQDELKSAEEQRALFNKREAIFGQEQTDYSQVAPHSLLPAPSPPPPSRLLLPASQCPDLLNLFVLRRTRPC